MNTWFHSAYFYVILHSIFVLIIVNCTFLFMVKKETTILKLPNQDINSSKMAF